VPGPHAFAVRIRAARLTTRTASIASRLAFVTIAIRPSCRGGTGRDNHIFPKNGRKIFFARGLDKRRDFWNGESDLPDGQITCMQTILSERRVRRAGTRRRRRALAMQQTLQQSRGSYRSASQSIVHNNLKMSLQCGSLEA
jgi:hypothetical protein